MDQKELALVGVTLASLGVIPFFFTSSFQDGFFGHERTPSDCSAFEQCVTECVETGPSARHCAKETCAALPLHGPTKVFECRESYLESGPWKSEG